MFNGIDIVILFYQGYQLTCDKLIILFVTICVIYIKGKV